MAIKSFRDKDAQALFQGGNPKRLRSFGRVAQRKLLQLEAAVGIESLKVPPGNHLEKLVGDRDGQYSIRVNDKWRVCFRWTEDGPEDVEIVNYHH